MLLCVSAIRFNNLWSGWALATFASSPKNNYIVHCASCLSICSKFCSSLTSEIFDIIKFWYQSITKGIPNRQVGQIYLGQECCVLRKNLGVLLCKTNPVSRTTALLTTATTTFGIPLVINLVIKTLLFMTITSDVRCPKGVSRWRGWSGDKSNK